MTIIKRCTKCGLEKDESDFYRNSRSKDGLTDRCKVCLSEDHKLYREKNRDMVNEKSKKYDLSHPEQVKERGKRYRELHRNQINEYARLKTATKREWIRSCKTDCVKCGESRKHIIDFHHINPTEKKINFGTNSTVGKSKQSLMDEMIKCVCLCRNCHADFHYIYGNVPTSPVESLSEYLGCDPYSVVPKVEKESVL